MDVPKTAEEAARRGWRKATADEVSAMLAHPETQHLNPLDEGDLCHNGPCINGTRTVCYRDANGNCTNCSSSTEGCG
jgi:hypothetical protein